MRGLFYVSPLMYECFMRLLYGREFAARYEAVARVLEGCDSVVDVCCGPAILTRWLNGRIDYQGLDCNPTFVRSVSRHGFRVIEADVRDVDIPRADAIVLMSSLYHFIPEEDDLINRMIAACRTRVIICEPVKHTSHKNPWLTRFAESFMDPGIPYSHERFDEASMAACFRRLGFQHTEPVGTRELMGVFEKRG